MAIYDSWLYSKEQERTFRPTLLFKISFANGVHICVSSAFNGSNPDMDDIGTVFAGEFYNAAIVDQKIGGLQSSSGMGIDTMGSISITLSDANARWFAYEMAFGFGGATLTAAFALYDPTTDQYSPDSKLVYEGQCDPAQYQNNRTVINSISTYNLSKQLFPPIPSTRNCPLLFPSTYEQRTQAAANELSLYFMCGYSPDAGSGFQWGNVDPSTGAPYTSCTYDKAGCQARGMYSSDNAGRYTSRFAGSQWAPPATWKGNSYVQDKLLQGVNNENLSKYSGYWPVTFGTTWVSGVCANVVGDPNSTRGEVVIGCFPNQIGDDWKNRIPYVVVNGARVPYQAETSDLLFRWYGMRDGVRSGGINASAIYESKGDPYGNLVVIMPIVYAEMAQSSVNMDVKALITTRPVPVYTGDGNWTWQRNDSIAWTVYEIFRVVRPDLYSRINIQSVINYEFVCSNGIQYRKSDGSFSFHGRYRVSLAITKEMTVSQLIEGLKLAGRLMIVPDADGSRINFVCRQSLADQQQYPIAGSNNYSAFSSYRRTDDPNGGPSGVGYIAYDFDESNILPGSFRIIPPSIQQLPTIIKAAIQDEDNLWTPDSISVGSVQAYNTIQQRSQTTIQAIGLPNYDQAYRVINSKFAELWTGNPRGDYKGSLLVQFSSGFRANHLTLGSIIRVKSHKHNLGPQFFRIESISPSKDCSQISITARWHDDRWYCDRFGQQS